MFDVPSLKSIAEKIISRASTTKQNKNLCNVVLQEVVDLLNYLKLVEDAEESLLQTLNEDVDKMDSIHTLSQTMGVLKTDLLKCMDLINAQNKKAVVLLAASFDSMNIRGQFVEAVESLKKRKKHLMLAMSKAGLELPESLSQSEAQRAAQYQEMCAALHSDDLQDLLNRPVKFKQGEFVKLEVLERQAMEHYNDGDMDAYIQSCKEIIDLQPDEAYISYAYYNIACGYAQKDDFTSAVAQLHSAVEHGFIDIHHMEKDRDLIKIKEAHPQQWQTVEDAILAKINSIDFWKQILTAEEIDRCSQVFKHYDTDGSNTISLDEFKVLMREIDADIADAEIQQKLDYIDVNHNGVITFEEFLNAYATDRK